MPIKRLGGVLAFGCFHAMINSFGYIGFPYLVGALSVFSRSSSRIYRKRFAQTTLAIQCFGFVALGVLVGGGAVIGLVLGWAK